MPTHTPSKAISEFNFHLAANLKEFGLSEVPNNQSQTSQKSDNLNYLASKYESKASGMDRYLLGAKKGYIIVCLPGLFADDVSMGQASIGEFGELARSIFSRIYRKAIAELLDSLAVKYRVVFTPSPIYNQINEQRMSGCRISDFATFSSQDELFSTCDNASIALEMKYSASTHLLSHMSISALACMTYKARLILTTSDIYYDICNHYSIPALLLRSSIITSPFIEAANFPISRQSDDFGEEVLRGLSKTSP